MGFWGKNKAYHHFPVDKVCDTHIGLYPKELKQHVLQPSSGMRESCVLDSGSFRPSLYFQVFGEVIDKKLDFMAGFKASCFSSCITCTHPDFKNREAARDLLLLITLENKKNKTVIIRKALDIWLLAVVKKSRLALKERRKPKGSIPQLRNKRIMFEKTFGAHVLIENILTNQALLNKYSIRKQLSDYKGVSKVINLKPRLNRMKGLGSQTISHVRVPVLYNQGEPSEQEILSSIADFVASKAIEFGLSESKFIDIIRKSYNMQMD